jgi:hypothetical protein
MNRCKNSAIVFAIKMAAFWAAILEKCWLVSTTLSVTACQKKAIFILAAMTASDLVFSVVSCSKFSSQVFSARNARDVKQLSEVAAVTLTTETEEQLACEDGRLLGFSDV